MNTARFLPVTALMALALFVIGCNDAPENEVSTNPSATSTLTDGKSCDCCSEKEGEACCSDEAKTACTKGESCCKGEGEACCKESGKTCEKGEACCSKSTVSTSATTECEKGCDACAKGKSEDCKCGDKEETVTDETKPAAEDS